MAVARFTWWTEISLSTPSTVFNDGTPLSNLVLDPAGNLHGTTLVNPGGTVYELSPSDGGWTFNVLYTIPGPGQPYGPIAIDSAGKLYGETAQAPMGSDRYSN
jgi:hypothetical protein